MITPTPPSLIQHGKEHATQGSTEEGYVSPLLFLQREQDAALGFCFSLLISSMQISQLEKPARDFKQNKVSSFFVFIYFIFWKQCIQAGFYIYKTEKVLTNEMTSTTCRLYATRKMHDLYRYLFK